MTVEALDRTPVKLVEAADYVCQRIVEAEPNEGASPQATATIPTYPWRASPPPERRGRDDLLVALRDGDLQAKGRYSNTPAAPWESPHPGRQWMLHSGQFSAIPPEGWRAGHVDWATGVLTLAEGQFIDVQVPRFMLKAIWPGAPLGREADGTPAEERYTTVYLELLERAIAVQRITADCQPKKEILVEWFRGQVVEGEPLSANLASAMATLVRLPSSQKGGNRKWS